MDDDQVEKEILRVLGEASSPLKALDIARKIGNGCDRKMVNRVLHNRLKDRGAQLATPPGQNPPLWRISPTSAQLGGVAPSTPRGASTYPQSVPSPDPPPPRAVGVAIGPRSPGNMPFIPATQANEPLYTKKEHAESGTISFTPVGHQHPPTSRIVSGANHMTPTTVETCAEVEPNIGYAPNPITAHASGSQNARSKCSPNLFTPTDKGYTKDVPKKPDTALSRELNNSEASPINTANSCTPPSNIQSTKGTPSSTQPSPLEATPSNSKPKKKNIKLAAKFSNSPETSRSPDVETLSSNLQSLSVHETSTGERVLQVLKANGEMKELEIVRLVGGGTDLSAWLAKLQREAKIRKREDVTGTVYWRIAGV